MSLRIIGALLVILGSGSFGFRMVTTHRKQVRDLEQLIIAVEFMCCELRYRLTPLAELCNLTAEVTKGPVRSFFTELSRQLHSKLSPRVSTCVGIVTQKQTGLSQDCSEFLRSLGDTLGNFDLQGQLKGLEALREKLQSALNLKTKDQDIRIRSYQTLGLCTGAAIAILFV